MIKGLRTKFICITMVILTVMMTVLMISQLNTTRNSLMQINMKALEDAARAYREDKPEGGRPGFDRLIPVRPRTGLPDSIRPEGEHPCFILQLDSAGVLSARGSSYYDLSDRDVLLEIYRRTEDREKISGVLWDYRLQYLKTDAVYAFTDISAEVETMQEMVRNSIIIWNLGVAVFLILSIFLANWAIRPVERAWEQQRQFVADASHELKTPLTVILTNAELLREQAENPRQRQFSDSIVTMSTQMRGLVESMLQLARADGDQTGAQYQRLDFSALLEQTVLPFDPLFFEGGLTLDSQIRPGIRLTGNADQLRRVAEILLDNALKYASAGGTVRLKLESRGSQCMLSVSSPGEPLTARQCRDIFKRFYRVDPARGRNGSYGLGLAIAQQVVSAHRGKIWAESRDGLNTFYVNLPMS